MLLSTQLLQNSHKASTLYLHWRNLIYIYIPKCMDLASKLLVASCIVQCLCLETYLPHLDVTYTATKKKKKIHLPHQTLGFRSSQLFELFSSFLHIQELFEEILTIHKLLPLSKFVKLEYCVSRFVLLMNKILVHLKQY